MFSLKRDENSLWELKWASVLLDNRLRHLTIDELIRYNNN